MEAPGRAANDLEQQLKAYRRSFEARKAAQLGPRTAPASASASAAGTPTRLQAEPTALPDAFVRSPDGGRGASPAGPAAPRLGEAVQPGFNPYVDLATPASPMANARAYMLNASLGSVPSPLLQEPRPSERPKALSPKREGAALGDALALGASAGSTLESPQGPGPFGMSPESRPAARPAPADTAKSGPGQVAQLAQKFGGQSASSEKEEKPKANEAHEAHEAHEAKGAGPVGPGLPHGPVNGASGASATSGATSAAGGQAATSTSAAGTRLPQPMAPGQLAGRLPTLPLQRAGADRVDRVEAEASRDPVQRRRQQVQAAIAAYDQELLELQQLEEMEPDPFAQVDGLGPDVEELEQELKHCSQRVARLEEQLSRAQTGQWLEEAPSDASTSASLGASLEDSAWQQRAEVLRDELLRQSAMATEVQDRIHWLRAQMQRQPGLQDKRMQEIVVLLAEIAEKVPKTRRVEAIRELIAEIAEQAANV